MKMSSAFASIQRGLEEAIAHSKGETTAVKVFTPVDVDVKVIREKTGLSQTRFASILGISVKTLRHWEHGDIKPQGPALVLLNAAARDHKKLLEILSSPLIAV
jgi:putative transcriptional regulator